MKITIESTNEVGCTTEGVHVRKWIGTTERGNKCSVMVLGVYASADDVDALREIAAELCSKGDLRITTFALEAARFPATNSAPTDRERFAAAWLRLHAEGKVPNYRSLASAIAYREWLRAGRQEPAAWIAGRLKDKKEG